MMVNSTHIPRLVSMGVIRDKNRFAEQTLPECADWNVDPCETFSGLWGELELPGLL